MSQPASENPPIETGAPPAAPAPRRPGLRAIGWLVRRSLQTPGAVAAVFVLGAVLAASRYGRAWLVQPLLDRVVVPATAEEIGFETVAPLLGEIALLAGLTLIAAPLAVLGRGYAAEWIAARVRRDVDLEIARKLLHAPLRVFREGTRGDFLTRAMDDLQFATRAVTLLYKDVILAVEMIVIGVGVLLLISWQLALIALVALPPFGFVVVYFSVAVREVAVRRQDTQSELAGRLVAILSGIKVIKAFRGEGVEQAAFDHQTGKYFNRHMKLIRNGAIIKAAGELMYPAVGGGVIVFGTWCITQDLFGLTFGKLTSAAWVMAILYKPVKNVTKAYTRLMEYASSADRLRAVLELGEEPADPPDARPMPDRTPRLVLRNVGFDYGEGPVLEDIDLEIEPGEVVAIVGRTGAGKSTLAELLLRFHEPTAGTIEADGVELRQIARRSFLEHVALVTQEPFLFDDTIAANIRYGRPDATDEAVVAAARAASAHEFIEALPEGYDTLAGEFGLRLSGGQRQRITIARAILSNARILVFDEATSALDAQTERAVQDAIEDLRGDSTVVIVAHRISTVERADRIVVLEAGRIVEVGDHATLLARNGRYAELVRGPLAGAA